MLLKSLRPHRTHRTLAARLFVALAVICGFAAPAVVGAQERRGDPLRRTPVRIERPSTVMLEGSHDLGDLGPIWSNELSIEGTERLLFRWRTTLQNIAAARWEVLDKDNEVLAFGDLASIPPAGEYRQFSVLFSEIPLERQPRVRVQPFDGEGKALGASTEIRVLKAGPAVTTVFTDRGLNMPITPMLEGVRNEFNVPAIGGAVVTRHGIDVLDVVGIRKHGSSTPAEREDRWHLGSDTKAMTSTLIGILVEKGTVHWSTTVAQAFPEWAGTMDARFQNVTLEHLMAHRSGILSTLSKEQEALNNTSLAVTGRRREFARLITHRPHGGAIDLTYKYQNANYILAGAMLERCTGKSWETLMQQELFGPLGMSTAGFGAPGSAQNVSQPFGHSDKSGERVASKNDNPAALGPAGTVHASLRDWAKFIRLHLTGSEGSLTLKPSTLQRLHTQFAPSHISPERYGWGWIMFDSSFGPGLGHDGSNTLWYCSCQVYPEQGVAFLAVTNIGGGDFGNGGDACSKVIRNLRDRHFE